MKIRLLLLIIVIGLFCPVLNAQIELKTEYIGISKYKDIDNNETGGKGDAKVLSGVAQIPFYYRVNKNDRPIMWGAALGGTYTSFGNKNIPLDLSPKKILNGQFSLLHIRPISNKWSILASLGAGFYTAHADFSDITMNNVLGHGGLVFLWHLRDTLDVV